MIKTILFDFYGVFLPDTYTAWLNTHGLTRTGEYQAIVEKLDKGTLSSEDFFLKLGELSSYSPTTIKNDFQQARVVNEPIVSLLKALATQCTVALTSNGTSHTRELVKEVGIDQYFANIFISSEMGVAKPNPAFFTRVIDELNAKTDETVLIDDSRDNIVSANAFGLKTIQFTRSEDLIESLSRMGVVIDGSEASDQSSL